MNYFKRLYSILFKDVIKMNVDDETWMNIFIHDRANNAELFRYTSLGNNCYLKTKKD